MNYHSTDNLDDSDILLNFVNILYLKWDLQSDNYNFESSIDKDAVSGVVGDPRNKREALHSLAGSVGSAVGSVKSRKSNRWLTTWSTI